MKNILDAIGHTPLVRLNKIEQAYQLPFRLYGKLERCNPSGSVKDRAAKMIIEEALKKQEIDQYTTIVEATSGNMGISLAMVCQVYALKCVIFMPKSASIERYQMMKSLGSEVILIDDGGMKGCLDALNKYCLEHENCYHIDQFNNPYNSLAHYHSTAPEIEKDLGKVPDCLIAGFGTSGTLMGCAKYFKEKGNTHVIGLEPLESPLLTKKQANNHKIQGIGANFIPGLFDDTIVDEVDVISGSDSYQGVKTLAKLEGIMAGISSGAALSYAVKLDKNKYQNQDVVIILPDNLERYLTVKDLYE